MLLVCTILGTAYLISVQPEVRLTAPKMIGEETPVELHVESDHGVRRIVAYLEQGGRRFQVFE